MEAEKEWSVWQDKKFILLIGVLLAVLVGALWAVWTGTEESKRVVAMVEKGTAIVAAAGVILTVYVMIGQVRASIRQTRLSANQARDSLRVTAEWRDQDKRAAILEETFRLIEKWDDPHFHEARTLVRSFSKVRSSTSDEEVIKKINEDPKLEASVNLMLNYFDFVRMSIKHERVDHPILKDQVGPMALKHIERIEVYVKTKSSIYMEDVNEFKKMMMP